MRDASVAHRIYRDAFELGLRTEKSLQHRTLMVRATGPLREDGRFLERVDMVPYTVHHRTRADLRYELEAKVEELWSWWLEQLVDLDHATAAGPLVKW